MTVNLMAALVAFAVSAALSVLSGLLLNRMLKKRGYSAEEVKRQTLAAAVGIIAVLGGAAGYFTGFSLKLVYLLLILPICAMITAADFKYRIIPNELILALMALTLVFGLVGAVIFRPLSSLGGLVFCFLIFLLPAAFGKNVGAGDVKLAGAIGFCAGLIGGLYSIALMGILVMVFALAGSKEPLMERFRQYIPMGPFMAVSFLAVQVML